MRTSKSRKPKKPRPDFPLFYHQTGQWAKKVRGKLHYFGTDATAAEEKWLADKDHLLAGKPRPTTPDGLTLRELVNTFLTRKKEHVASGELSMRTWSGYYTSCGQLLEALGKQIHVADLTPEDFAKYRARLARRFGSVALGNEIQRLRTLFKFAFENGHIDKPVRFGDAFKKPSKKNVRKARHAAGPRMFEAEDLRALIGGAVVPGDGGPELVAPGVALKAMILLGVNCAFGQSDVAGLPTSALDLDRGWVTFPREKTAIARRCPLWPETVQALKAVAETRPEPADFEACGLAFVTKYGRRWVRIAERKTDGKGKAGVVTDAVTLEFSKLLKALGLKRKGLGFYALRHTFRTIADRSKDQPAVDYIMGHVREDMASLYRERIEDDRLEAVVKIVRGWLFGKGVTA